MIIFSINIFTKNYYQNIYEEQYFGEILSVSFKVLITKKVNVI